MVMISYIDGKIRRTKYCVSRELIELIEFTGREGINIPARTCDGGSSAVVFVDFDQDFPGKFEYIVSRIMKS